MTTTPAPATATAGLFGELRNKSGWLLAMGVVSIALGTFGLARVAFRGSRVGA